MGPSARWGGSRRARAAPRVNPPTYTHTPRAQVNMSLRQQARAGMVYAPGLTYVPPPAPDAGNGNGRAAAAPFVSAPAGAAAAAAPAAAPVAVIAPPKPAALSAAVAAPGPAQSLFSMDEDEMSADQIQCRCADQIRSLCCYSVYVHDSCSGACLAACTGELVSGGALAHRQAAPRGLPAALTGPAQASARLAHVYMHTHTHVYI